MLDMDQPEDDINDVMIAEDDQDDFELLTEAIHSLPVKVEITRAEDGEILLRLMDEKTPDLLFLDIIIPCKDGKDCLREIRSNQKYDNLPIIVYSSLSDLRTIDTCFRHGANLFLRKPDTYEGIIEGVRKIFSINWKKIKYYPARPDFVLNP
jgi:CheY-like chemotaxis protein